MPTVIQKAKASTSTNFETSRNTKDIGPNVILMRIVLKQ